MNDGLKPREDEVPLLERAAGPTLSAQAFEQQATTNAAVTKVVAGDDALLPNEENERKNVEIPKTYARIYLLRHLPCTFDAPEDAQRFKDLRGRVEQGLSITEIEQKELARLDRKQYIRPETLPAEYRELYSLLFQSPETCLLWYDGSDQGKERVKKSAEHFVGEYRIPSENVRNGIHLPGTDKNKPPLEALIECWQGFTRLKKEQIDDPDSDLEGKRVFLLGNRSYAFVFRAATGDRRTAIQSSEKALEGGEYMFFDIDSSREPIDPKEYIQVSPSNFQAIQKAACELFPGLELKQDIIVFQNDLNEKVYKELRKEKTEAINFLINLLITAQPELQSFALRKLLHTDDMGILLALTSVLKKIEFQPHILRVFFENRDRSELWRDALLGSLQGTTDVTAIYNLCQAFGLEHEFKNFFHLQKILSRSYERAEAVFTISLDQILREKKEPVRRSFFYFEREIDPSTKEVLKYNRVSPGFFDLVTDSHERYVLLANVGEGKSTVLADMKFILESPYLGCNITLFYTAISFEGQDATQIVRQIEEEITIVRKCFPGKAKRIVVLFDGIDELEPMIRTGLVNYLLGNEKKDLTPRTIADCTVYLGSRPSGFEKYRGETYRVLHFDEIIPSQRRHFITSRLQSLGVTETDRLKGAIRSIEDFLKSAFLEEDLKNTPLVLFFLCQIAASLPEGETLQNYIANRADLYEKIVQKIFLDHQEKKDLALQKRDYKLFTDTLGYCAYQKRFGKKKLEVAEIKSFLEQKGGYAKDDPGKDADIQRVIDQVFLLYKMDSGEYQFILKSFEEYFLAKYLAEGPEMLEPDQEYEGFTKGDGEIFRVIDKDSGIEGSSIWQEFKPVTLFYGQILGNSMETANIKRLIKFLGPQGLAKRDNALTETFFTRLGILYTLPSIVAEDKEIKQLIRECCEQVSKWDSLETRERRTSAIEFSRNTGCNNLALLLPFILSVMSKKHSTHYSAYETISALVELGSVGIRRALDIVDIQYEQKAYFIAAGLYLHLLYSRRLSDSQRTYVIRRMANCAKLSNGSFPDKELYGTIKDHLEYDLV